MEATVPTAETTAPSPGIRLRQHVSSELCMFCECYYSNHFIAFILKLFRFSEINFRQICYNSTANLIKKNSLSLGFLLSIHFELGEIAKEKHSSQIPAYQINFKEKLQLKS